MLKTKNRTENFTANANKYTFFRVAGRCYSLQVSSRAGCGNQKGIMIQIAIIQCTLIGVLALAIAADTVAAHEAKVQ